MTIVFKFFDFLVYSPWLKVSQEIIIAVQVLAVEVLCLWRFCLSMTAPRFLGAPHVYSRRIAACDVFVFFIFGVTRQSLSNDFRQVEVTMDQVLVVRMNECQRNLLHVSTEESIVKVRHLFECRQVTQMHSGYKIVYVLRYM